jgi:hypothetical protein
MAILLVMEWPAVTQAQYEEAMRELNMDGDPPVGGLIHVAALTSIGLRLVDVWESEAAFQTFAETRMGPAARKVGITSEPRVEIAQLHNVYVPALSAIGAIGASSLPASLAAFGSTPAVPAHGFLDLGEPLLYDTSALSGLK